MSWLDLNQRVTYWLPGSYDDNNEVTYSAGAAIDAKWSESEGLTTNVNGKELNLTLFIYSETEIPKDSLVALGDFDGLATPPDNARAVVDVKSNPSMDTLFKMVL